jgi:hypothetical protein
MILRNPINSSQMQAVADILRWNVYVYMYIEFKFSCD